MGNEVLSLSAVPGCWGQSSATLTLPFSLVHLAGSPKNTQAFSFPPWCCSCSFSYSSALWITEKTDTAAIVNAPWGQWHLMSMALLRLHLPKPLSWDPLAPGAAKLGSSSSGCLWGGCLGPKSRASIFLILPLWLQIYSVSRICKWNRNMQDRGKCSFAECVSGKRACPGSLSHRFPQIRSSPIPLSLSQMSFWLLCVQSWG